MMKEDILWAQAEMVYGYEICQSWNAAYLLTSLKFLC
jgi:hypothetical protein